MTKKVLLFLLAGAVAACGPAVEEPAPSTSAPPMTSPTERRSAQQKAGIEQMLFEHETAWGRVALNRDTSILEQVLADDLVYTTADGEVIGKAQIIEDFANDPNTYTEAEISDSEAHWYAENVVLVIGAYRQAGQDTEGNPVEQLSRFTNVWVERDGQWQCVVGHTTGDLS